MNCNTLPGIVRIEAINCADIQPEVMMASICGGIVALSLDSRNVKFYGTPLLKWSGEIENGARVEKSTLEFNTTDKLPEGARIAFVVTTASSRQCLIGAREPNYPVIEYSETTGAPDGDAALRSYKITHTALKSVLPCVL